MRPIKRQLQDDSHYLWREKWRARLSGRPHFHGGIESPRLEQHLQAIDFHLPPLVREGRHEFRVATLAGELTAAIHIHTLGVSTSPVLIYHHDAGEVPATRTIAEAFPRHSARGLAIYAIEAPFHADAESCAEATNSVVNLLAMQAVALLVTQELLRHSSVAAAPLRILTGYGQGGFIANRHHVLFNSADIYIPFMAGAAPAEHYLGALPTSLAARRQPAKLRALLNFDAKWADRSHPNVFPVLASSDLINRFDAQARSYGRTPIEVWPTAHIAGTKDVERMRRKIARHILEAAKPRRQASGNLVVLPLRARG